MNLWQELWDERRGLVKLIIGEVLVFVVLLGLVAGLGVLIERAPLPEGWRPVVEQVHAWAWMIVLFGSLGTFVLSWFMLLAADIWKQGQGARKRMKLGGADVSVRALEIEVQNQIKAVEKSLETKFPLEASSALIPPGDEKLAYDAHVIEFLRSVGVTVQSVPAWNAVGNYYFGKGSEEGRRKAEEAYNIAIQIDGTNPFPYVSRGALRFIQQDRPILAERDFTQAIKLGERRGIRVPWAYWGLAAVKPRTEASERRALLERAETIFEELARDYPDDPWVHYGLAYCYERTATAVKATASVKRAIELNPGFIAGYYNLACYHALEGNVDDCIKNLRRMVSWVAPLLRVYRLETDADLRNVQTAAGFVGFFDTFGLVYMPEE
jgi:tetratricopeptide (TPR) repeat protein